MIFTETKIKGAYTIDIERREDHRGFFARVWCEKEFETHGLVTRFVQSNIGFSIVRGTLRGMHYQVHPFQEAKLVRCTLGRVFDVVVDLRPGSATYRRWIGIELSEDNRRMVYVPEGCAHGYQALDGNTELVYDTSQFYSPQHAAGVLYCDSTFGINWPLPITVISDADRQWPLQVL